MRSRWVPGAVRVKGRSWAWLGVFMAGAVLSRPAWADPNDYIVTLDFASGEHELDTKTGWASSSRVGTSAASAYAVAAGMGFNDDWFSEVYLSESRGDGQPTGVSGYAWENIFRLTETGKYPVDLGLDIELERHATQAWPIQISLGPMLQWDWGQLQVNTNVLWQRQLGSGTPGITQWAYQVQAMWRGQTPIWWGAQMLGTHGPCQSGGAQTTIGPAAFAQWRLAPGKWLRANTALLLGATPLSPTFTLRAQLEYEF